MGVKAYSCDLLAQQLGVECLYNFTGAIAVISDGVSKGNETFAVSNRQAAC